MTHVVVDPVTRIEGHLRIETEVEGGKVQDAWSSATMFRGVELILKGRDPRDAWAFTQRICGVCTTVHAIASIRAVENAIGAAPPPNARLLRNLIISAQCVQDHVIHFYHLHALDWVDIVSALSADPAKTSALAQSISDWPLSSTTYFAGIQQRVKAFVERGQLGPFANAYWGHPAYKLPAEANLMAVAHYLEALDWQREFIKIHAVLGGKNPHLQSFLVGGMATPIDPDRQASLNAGSIAEIQELVKKGRDFVTKVYIPDLLAIASFYKEWASYGAGVGNYLVFGEYPEEDGSNARLFLPSGVIRKRDLSKIEKFDPSKITEQVKHSWYEYDGGDDKGLHPFQGETKPKYTGPKPPYQRLETAGKYSWLKSPRYDGEPMEVGPLARMLVAYASGQPRVKELVTLVLGKLGVGPEALFSTLGRVAARGIETQVLVEKMDDWLNGLAGNMARRELRIARQLQVGAEHVAPRGLGCRLPRGAPGRPRPLGPHPRRTDRQLPVRGPEHMERRTAGRLGQARPVRRSAPRHTDPRPHPAPGNPADRALVRPLHRVRRPRRRRAEARARAGEGPMSTARPLVDPSTVPPPADTDLVRVYVWEMARAPGALAHRDLDLLPVVDGHLHRPPLPDLGGRGPQPVHHGNGQDDPLLRRGRLHDGRPGAPHLDVHGQPLLPLGQVHSRRQTAAQRLLPVLKYYLFGLRKPPGFVGHNPLAGLTYAFVFLLFLTMIGTGIALRTVSASYQSPLRIFSFLLPLYGGPQAARWIHHVGMWLIWGFAVHHVYSAILMSQVEGNGTIESIFSGYKFVHRDDVVYSGYRFLSRKDDHG